MSTLPFFRRPSPLSLLHAAGTSALLVTNLTNIRYLTGVQASAGIALVLPKRIELFLDGRYHEAASRIVTLPVILRPVEELNETLRSLKRTAYECDDVTVARLLNWQRKFKNTKFVQTSGIVEEFRRIKATVKFSTGEKPTNKLSAIVCALVPVPKSGALLTV
jgi:Xaa-Pro aminopeptidase